MLLSSTLEVYLEGIPFMPLRSFKLELLPDAEPIVATLVDFDGNEFLVFLERFEAPNRMFFKDAASAVALSRLNIDNPDYDPVS